MGLFELIIIIAAFGLFVWAIQTLVPMPLAFKNAITIIAILGLILYILRSFGVLHGFHDIRVW